MKDQMKIFTLAILVVLNSTICKNESKKFDVIGESTSNPYSIDRPAISHNIAHNSYINVPVSFIIHFYYILRD